MPPPLVLAGYSANVLLPTTTITTAVTALVTTPVVGLIAMQSVVLQADFVYGSGGTNTTAWVQTSFDGGVAWMDIACFQYTTVSARRIHSVRSATVVAADYTPTDGTLVANTIKDGLLGDRLRIKLTTTGTYGGTTTLAITAVTKGT